MTHVFLLSSIQKNTFKTFERENVKKKHKRLINSAKGIDFGNYSKRINSVRDIKNSGQLLPDKKYYFCNGMVSPSFFHPHLKEIVAFKQERKQRIEMYIH